MTTPLSGTISMYQAAAEAKINLLTGPASLDDAEIRKLCNLRSGQISMDDLHNRTYGVGPGYLLSTFVDVSGATESPVLSNTVSIAGAGSSQVQLLILTDAPNGVEYSINGGAWYPHTAPGQIKDQDTLQLRMNTSSNAAYAAQARYGSMTLQWNVSTGVFAAIPILPLSGLNGGVSPNGRAVLPSVELATSPYKFKDTLYAIDPDGSIAWQQAVPERRNSSVVSCDSSGNTYYMRVGGPSNSASASLAKFDSTGALQWHVLLGPAGGGLPYMACSPSAVIVGGSVSGSSVVTSLSANGSLSWTKSIPGASRIACVNCDQSGNVYVAGSVVTPGSDTALFVMKLSASGVVVWQAGLNAASFNDEPTSYDGLALDDSGNVFVTASAYLTNPHSFLAKFNSSGVKQWSVSHPFKYISTVFATDASVYLTGYNQDSSYQNVVCRYSTATGQGTGQGLVANYNLLASRASSASEVYDYGTLYTAGIDSIISSLTFGTLNVVSSYAVSLTTADTTIGRSVAAFAPF